MSIGAIKYSNNPQDTKIVKLVQTPRKVNGSQHSKNKQTSTYPQFITSPKILRISSIRTTKCFLPRIQKYQNFFFYMHVCLESIHKFKLLERESIQCTDHIKIQNCAGVSNEANDFNRNQFANKESTSLNYSIKSKSWRDRKCITYHTDIHLSKVAAFDTSVTMIFSCYVLHKFTYKRPSIRN